jgi:hypothetical protein
MGGLDMSDIAICGGNARLVTAAAAAPGRLTMEAEWADEDDAVIVELLAEDVVLRTLIKRSGPLKWITHYATEFSALFGLFFHLCGDAVNIPLTSSMSKWLLRKLWKRFAALALFAALPPPTSVFLQMRMRFRIDGFRLELPEAADPAENEVCEGGGRMREEEDMLPGWPPTPLIGILHTTRYVYIIHYSSRAIWCFIVAFSQRGWAAMSWG